jgi:hypothetical protein
MWFSKTRVSLRDCVTRNLIPVFSIRWSHLVLGIDYDLKPFQICLETYQIIVGFEPLSAVIRGMRTTFIEL